MSSKSEQWPKKLEEPKAPVHPGAPKRLECETCGLEVKPVVTKPKRETADWWDDPSPYLACPKGHFIDWMSPDADLYYSWLPSGS